MSAHSALGSVGRSDPDIQRHATSAEIDCSLFPSPRAESSVFIFIIFIFKEPNKVNAIVIPVL